MLPSIIPKTIKPSLKQKVVSPKEPTESPSAIKRQTVDITKSSPFNKMKIRDIDLTRITGFHSIAMHADMHGPEYGISKKRLYPDQFKKSARQLSLERNVKVGVNFSHNQDSMTPKMLH